MRYHVVSRQRCARAWSGKCVAKNGEKNNKQKKNGTDTARSLLCIQLHGACLCPPLPDFHVDLFRISMDFQLQELIDFRISMDFGAESMHAWNPKDRHNC